MFAEEQTERQLMAMFSLVTPRFSCRRPKKIEPPHVHLTRAAELHQNVIPPPPCLAQPIEPELIQVSIFRKLTHGSKHSELFLDSLTSEAFPNPGTVGQKPYRRVTVIFIYGGNVGRPVFSCGFTEAAWST